MNIHTLKHLSRNNAIKSNKNASPIILPKKLLSMCVSVGLNELANRRTISGSLVFLQEMLIDYVYSVKRRAPGKMLSGHIFHINYA